MSRANGHSLPIVGGRFAELPHRADREPPNNKEAEQSLLGSILHDNEQLEAIRGLVSMADFYQDRYAIIFQAMVDIADNHDAPEIDNISLEMELKRQNRWAGSGEYETVTELYESVPHGVNAKYYAGIVRERAVARRLIEAHSRGLDDAYSNQFTAQELVELASKRLIGAEPPPDEEEGLVTPGAWPDAMGDAAFHGVIGDVVRRIAPHTEADPAAILVQLLVAFGNAAGHGPHWRVGATRHGLNLFACVVGRSSRSRKGTGWDYVRDLMREVDPEWDKSHVHSGLSSGEGMIEIVRDPRYVREKVGGAKELGGGGYEEVMVDPGVEDKRALFIETEFGSTLTAKGREGNTLDGAVKKFWENGNVQTCTKGKPSRCTDAHISIIGHVTMRELLSKLGDVDVCGGLANRFLWCCSRRTKFLPHGGAFRIRDFQDVIVNLRLALDTASDKFTDWLAPMSMSPEAREAWVPLYQELGSDRPGILDDMCSRAEPQALRLAALYAILDRSTRIELEHLMAGVAVWRYCEASVRCIFGDRAQDDPDEKRLLAALEGVQDGLCLTSIRRSVFKGKKSAEETSKIIGALVRTGKVSVVSSTNGGRPKTVLMITKPAI